MPTFLEKGMALHEFLAQFVSAAIAADERYVRSRDASEIGRGIGGRNHTTVLHAVNRVDATVRTDPAVRNAVDNLRRILAVELTAAARGLELRAPLEPAAGTRAALEAVRTAVPGTGPDRWLAPELEAVDALVRSPALLDSVDDVVGGLA